jgi:hypothetical protein
VRQSTFGLILCFEQICLNAQCIMMVVDFFLVWFYYPETSSISLEQMQPHFALDELERQL